MNLFQIAESKIGVTDGQASNSVSALSARDGCDGASLVQRDQIDRQRLPFVIFDEADQRNHVMRALGKERVVIAKGVSSRLARVFHTTRARHGLALRSQF